jgi:glycine oxidase
MNILIIGQGTAGSIAGWTLMQRGHTVTWIDKPELSQASRIASGLYNPIVLKRMRIVHLAEKMLEHVEPTFRKLEKDLQESFFYPTPIQRIFHSVKEENDWNSKSGSAPWNQHLNGGTSLEGLKTPFGTGEVKLSGWVNTKKFLDVFRNKYSNFIIEKNLNYSDFIIENNAVQYNGKKYDLVIFAEGWLASKNNPFYPKDAFRPSKGELLTIKHPDLNNNLAPIHYSHFLLPGISEGSFRTGATYVHGEPNEIPTVESRKELENALKEILVSPENLEVTDQKVGVRAATKDRRPMIGRHPIYKNVYFLNGLGSRSVLMTPYLAFSLAELIESNVPIHPDIDIRRFF